jgi:hypothetical protein
MNGAKGAIQEAALSAFVAANLIVGYTVARAGASILTDVERWRQGPAN